MANELDEVEVLRNHILNFKISHGESELSVELSALLTSKAKSKVESALWPVYRAIVRSDTAGVLDPLNVLPLLLDSPDPAAGDILSLVAECGNAKEVILAAQESLGFLRVEIGAGEQDGDTVFLRLERLLSLYTAAIPRLNYRKRLPSETLRPAFSKLDSLIESISSNLTAVQGRKIIDVICDLFSSAIKWSECQPSEEDRQTVKELCQTIFISTVSELSRFLPPMSRRRFRACFPRLARVLEQDDEELLLKKCLDAALLLGCSYARIQREHSPSAVVELSLLLSEADDTKLTSTMFSFITPILISALQASFTIDACLHILLVATFPPPNSSFDIDPDMIPALCTSLAPIAATSPDQNLRLIAFRLIGGLIARAPPLERMTLLRELLKESPFPAMRVAAVGLLKDNIIEAFNPNAAPSPFSSPALMQTFGPIILRSDPSDLFKKTDRGALDSFVDSQEPKRLVECLSLYYVLFMRDTSNKTGVRDKSQMTSVENEFIGLVRSALDAWSTLDGLENDEHTMMALAALETAIERIDEAFATAG